MFSSNGANGTLNLSNWELVMLTICMQCFTIVNFSTSVLKLEHRTVSNAKQNV